jgi:hypothetical protein
MNIIFVRGGWLVAINSHPKTKLLKTVQNFQKLSKSSVLNIKAIRSWLLEVEQTNEVTRALHMNPGGFLVFGALSKSKVLR